MDNLFHDCGCVVPRAPRGSEDDGGGAGGRKQQRGIIDLHCHVLSQKVEQIVGNQPGKKQELAEMLRTNGAESVKQNFKLFAKWVSKLTKIDERLKDMDEMAVGIQAISPSPTQYYYWADPDLAAQIVLTQNQEISDICKQHPSRFVGIGNVALQHECLAVEQMRHAIENLGLKGFEVSSSINGIDIGHPSFDYFWKEIEALDCMVFLHPLGTSLGERLDTYYLSNIVGQPIETTIALSKMIFGGVFERFPALRVCAAHGGGYLPFYSARSDHGFSVRPEAQGIPKKPSEYLKQIYFDTVIYDGKSLNALIEQVGIEQVVVGTDYPFDMGSYDLTEMLDGISRSTAEERDLLHFGNAKRLLKI